jgi:hypothetical protein
VGRPAACQRSDHDAVHWESHNGLLYFDLDPERSNKVHS